MKVKLPIKADSANSDISDLELELSAEKNLLVLKLDSPTRTIGIDLDDTVSAIKLLFESELKEKK